MAEAARYRMTTQRLLPPRRRLRRIAIVGGGLTGTLAAIAIADAVKEPLEVVIFAADGPLAGGVAYGKARPGDSPNVRAASRYHYGELLDAGIVIYEYRPTMMHNKVMVVDSIWSTVGSINFVNRSMKKNAEVNVAIYDRGFAADVEAMVEKDIRKCDALTLAAWKKRGLLPRIGETFFWLFSENY